MSLLLYIISSCLHHMITFQSFRDPLPLFISILHSQQSTFSPHAFPLFSLFALRSDLLSDLHSRTSCSDCCPAEEWRACLALESSSSYFSEALMERRVTPQVILVLLRSFMEQKIWKLGKDRRETWEERRSRHGMEIGQGP